MLKKIQNFITLFVLLPLFLIISFGFGHSLGMEMKRDGTMGGCIFDRQAEICPMTFTEHIAQWRSMFNAIPQKNSILIQLFILVSVFVLSTLGIRRQVLVSLFGYFRERWKLYVRDNPHLPLFNYLRETFSQGTLNPKIY